MPDSDRVVINLATGLEDTGGAEPGGNMRIICKAFGLLVGAVLAGGILAPGAAAESASWINTKPITFSGLNTSSQGLPVPSNLQVSGHEGPITDVDLNVWGVDMADLGTLHLLLVSPSGESEIVMRAKNCPVAVSDRNIRFDQQAPHPADCPFTVAKPYDNCGSPCGDAPWEFVDGPHTDNFDHFNNENANGNWRLYAHRDCYDGSCPASGDQIGQGWSLSIDTGPLNLDLPAGGSGITFGPASPYASTRTVAGAGGVITDLNVRLDGVFHGNPMDIDMMLEGPRGQKVMLMSDACGTFDVNAYGWIWDDEAPGRMPPAYPTNGCGATRHRPTDHQPGDSLPAPAPPAPYSTSLSVFDGTDPNGDWRLWVADDDAREAADPGGGYGDEGFFTNQFTLQYTTQPVDSSPPETTIDKAPATRTTKRRARIKFSASEPGSTFECKLDRKSFKACSSPKRLKELDPGRHRFRVRATDPAGNTDPTPAKVRWRVLR